MKHIFRQLTRSFGFDIVRYSPVPLEQARAINSQQKGADFLKMLVYKQIDLVLDVGGNKGNFASDLFDIGYKGKIVSFEPLSSAYEQLTERSKNNSQWQVFERCAIGETEEDVEINIASNSESSSLLPMLQAHIDAAPRSTYIESEKVSVYRLDRVAKDWVEKASHTLLKIDTQGYELPVIKGAAGILDKVDGIHLEMPLVPLYEGEEIFDNMLHRIQDLGFSLYSISPGFKDYRIGRMLQVDGTFFRD